VILEAVRQRRIEPVISWDLVEELVDVLSRARIRAYGVTDADVDDVLALLRPMLPRVELAVEIRDPDDKAVVIAALAGRADAVLSGDRDLVDDDALRASLQASRIEVLTAAQLAERLAP